MDSYSIVVLLNIYRHEQFYYWKLSVTGYCSIAIQCPNLQGPPNGVVTLTEDTSVFSVAMYSCNFGYMIDRESNRTCQINGKWTGSQPFCVCKFSFKKTTCVMNVCMRDERSETGNGEV